MPIRTVKQPSDTRSGGLHFGHHKSKQTTSRFDALNLEVITKLVGYRGLTHDRYAYLRLADDADGYVEMMSVRGQDVGSLPPDDSVAIIGQYQDFLRRYVEATKIFVSPFPVDTSQQRGYWTRQYIKLNKELRSIDDPAIAKQLSTRIQFISDRIEQTHVVEQELFNQEYIMFFFGKTTRQLTDLISNAKSWGGCAVILEPISRKRKEEIVTRINNPALRIDKG